mmetsp:Transcript_20561/g.41161  ORF Transcript_20561/g.41161 Transcript_20561/m.41161 type:complete len:258 (-) Transcript_20561:511-1284(-)
MGAAPAPSVECIAGMPSYSPISPVKKVVRPILMTVPSSTSSSKSSKASKSVTSSSDILSSPTRTIGSCTSASSSSSDRASSVRSTSSSDGIPSGRSPSWTRASHTKGDGAPASRAIRCSSVTSNEMGSQAAPPRSTSSTLSACPCDVNRPRTSSGRHPPSPAVPPPSLPHTSAASASCTRAIVAALPRSGSSTSAYVASSARTARIPSKVARNGRSPASSTAAATRAAAAGSRVRGPKGNRSGTWGGTRYMSGSPQK